MEGFLRYEFGGLIIGEAYTRRGLFSEFYSNFINYDYNKNLIGYQLF